MKKVLIIGSEGRLGSVLSLTLKKFFDCITPPHRELDITNYTQTVENIKKFQPQVVINAAGFTDVDLCEKEKEKAFAVNAEGAKNVALGCKLIGAKCIYFSTDYIFDGKKAEPYKEEDTPSPLSIYGKSKLKGERYVREILDNYLIIRTSWLFSAYGSNFANTIIKLAREKKEIKMVSDQIGSPTYVPDLSIAVLSLLKNDLKGIFHIANTGYCSWQEFAQKILNLIGSDLRLVPISLAQSERLAPRPFYSPLSIEKLQKFTGLVMPHWEDAVVRCLQAMNI